MSKKSKFFLKKAQAKEKFEKEIGRELKELEGIIFDWAFLEGCGVALDSCIDQIRDTKSGK